MKLRGEPADLIAQNAWVAHRAEEEMVWQELQTAGLNMFLHCKMSP